MTPAKVYLTAIEEKLAQASVEIGSIRGMLGAAGQGLWEEEQSVFGAGALGGSIYNGNGGGGGGTDCLTINVKGYGCASPVALPSASVSVYDYTGGVQGPLVSFATTNAAGNVNLCLTDGHDYLVIASAVGHSPAAKVGTWPYLAGNQQIILGYPAGYICLGTCNNPVRRTLFLTSTFGTVQLAEVYINGSYHYRALQNATGSTDGGDCLSPGIGSPYKILWDMAIDDDTAFSTPYLSMYVVMVNCGGTRKPITNSDPTKGVGAGTTGSLYPASSVLLRASSYTCGPPATITYNFGGGCLATDPTTFATFPCSRLFGGAGTLTVTLSE